MASGSSYLPTRRPRTNRTPVLPGSFGPSEDDAPISDVPFPETDYYSDLTPIPDTSEEDEVRRDLEFESEQEEEDNRPPTQDEDLASDLPSLDEFEDYLRAVRANDLRALEAFSRKCFKQGIEWFRSVQAGTHQPTQEELDLLEISRTGDDVPLPAALRESWRILTTKETDQVASEKGKSQRFPEGFKGETDDDWLCWFDDMEAAFVAKGITLDVAKIFCAVRSMGYALRKEIETLDASRGHSWEDFKKAIAKEWAIDSKHGSQDQLQQVIDDFAPMSLQVSESRFNMFVRRFKSEANKLQLPPALFSNKTLVEMFLNCFDDALRRVILDGLQLQKQLRSLQQDPATEEEERRKQDPYKLEEVMAQAETVIRSGGGYNMMMRSHKASSGSSRRILKPSEPVKAEDEEERQAQSARQADVNNVQIRSLKEEIESFSQKMMENFKKSEKNLENQMIDLRKLVIPGNRESSTGFRANTTKQMSQMNTGIRGVKDFSGLYWMCQEPGHTSPECEHQQDFLRKGWLKQDPTLKKLVLMDGSPLPFVRVGDTEKQYEKILKKAKAEGWPGSLEEDPTAVMYAVGQDLTEVYLQEKPVSSIYLKEVHERMEELGEKLDSLMNTRGSESKN